MTRGRGVNRGVRVALLQNGETFVTKSVHPPVPVTTAIGTQASAHVQIFVDTGNNACVACPENCRRCSSLTDCTDCNPGKYGSTCENNCVPHCLECKEGRTYNPYHEVWELCTECEKGYHRNDRCYPCEEGCERCWWMPRSAVEECNRCKEGYYKDRMVPNR